MIDNVNESLRHVGKNYDTLFEPKSKTKVNKLTPIMLQRIKELYPTTKTALIADELGVSYSAVARNAKKMGVKKDKEFLDQLSIIRSKQMNSNRPPIKYAKSWFRKGESFEQRYGEEAEKKRREKVSEALKKRFRREKARVAYGLVQETKLKVTKEPKKKYCLRYFLKKRGYVLDEDNKIAYYNENTHRALKTESREQPWYKFMAQ